MGFAYDAEVLSLVLAARLQLVEQARTRCVMQADGISKGGHDIGHKSERCEIDEHDVIKVPLKISIRSRGKGQAGLADAGRTSLRTWMNTMCTCGMWRCTSLQLNSGCWRACWSMPASWSRIARC